MSRLQWPGSEPATTESWARSRGGATTRAAAPSSARTTGRTTTSGKGLRTALRVRVARVSARAPAEDALAVEPAVLDEDLRDGAPGRDAARQVHAGHVGLEGVAIAAGTLGLALERDADAAEQLEVGMEARERVDPVRSDPFLPPLGVPY